MSDFSLIGYCTDNYKNQNTTLTTDGSLNDNNAGSGGTGGSGGSSWGDSLSMGDLHTRILNVYNAVGRNVPSGAYAYVKTETRTYTGDGTFTREFTWSKTYKQATLAWYNAGGSYYIGSVSTSGYKYEYVGGYTGAPNSNYTSTITTIKDGVTSTSAASPTRQGALCYFPVTVNSNFIDVPETNTGYFVGRGSSLYGDLRLAKYSSSNISASLTSGSTYSATISDGVVTSDNLKVYTCSNGTFSLIQDDLSGVTEGVTGLVQYANARQNFAKSLKAQIDTDSRFAGFEFYGKGINSSKDYLVTAPIVSILGTTYYDYEMPECCIDFKVMTSGYISFFAGALYAQGSNNYFFSLHKIKRDGNNNIESIKQINQIYKNSGT